MLMESEVPANFTVTGRGLVDAMMVAWTQHRGLLLSPDDVWGAITFAFGEHVNANAEELRHTFVHHKGKKPIVIQLDGLLNTPTGWEDLVFPAFSARIREEVGSAIHDAVVNPFSTSTRVHTAVAHVTLMSSMQKYFDYGAVFLCGIPWVRLLGSPSDWRDVKSRAEMLTKLMTAEEDLGRRWASALIPVLDEFIAAAGGRPNRAFWQTMVRVRQVDVDMGCTAARKTFVSGWVLTLHPYLSSGKTHSLMDRHWKLLNKDDGVDTKELPVTLCSVPVTILGGSGPHAGIHFHAGSVGVRYIKAEEAVAPAPAWIITRDPPMSPKDELAKLRTQLAEIRKSDPGEHGEVARYLGALEGRASRLERELRGSGAGGAVT